MKKQVDIIDLENVNRKKHINSFLFSIVTAIGIVTTTILIVIYFITFINWINNQIEILIKLFT